MQDIVEVAECLNQSLVSATRAGIERMAEGNEDGNDALIAAMAGSDIYQGYERSFTEAIGMPVSLTPVETWQLPHHGRRAENPFCALLARKSHSCAVCLETQKELCEQAADEQVSLKTFLTARA